jgi:hypothetical protein
MHCRDKSDGKPVIRLEFTQDAHTESGRILRDIGIPILGFMILVYIGQSVVRQSEILDVETHQKTVMPDPVIKIGTVLNLSFLRKKAARSRIGNKQ